MKIYENEPLPDLPLPKTVVVGRDCLEIDEAAVGLWVISKKTLDWLTSQMMKWKDLDPSEEYKQQLNGIIDAIETRIKEMPEELREEFRETVIDEIVVPYINHLLNGEGEVESFTVDIDRVSADIVLDSQKSFGSVTLHVPHLFFLRSNKTARQLALKWHSPTLDGYYEHGLCRLRIAHWVCHEKTNDYFELARKLPASFDIPLPTMVSHTRICFMRHKR
ncbi:MAG: hypothetical protein ACOYM3_16260 [Terrimicrobiaceae bacterium]